MHAAEPTTAASTGREHIDFDGANFTAAQAESFVQIPFTFPRARPRSGSATATTTRRRPGRATRSTSASIEPKPGAQAYWDMPQRRGWSGSSRRDIVIAVNGFSPTATYEARRRTSNVSDTHTTTRAFKPGRDPQPATGRSSSGSRRSAAPRTSTASTGTSRCSSPTTTTQTEWNDDPYVPDPYVPNVANPSAGLVRGRLPRPRRAGARQRVAPPRRSTTLSTPRASTS